MGKMCQKIKKCFKKEKTPYVNMASIDNYIDKYFLIECCNENSVFRNNKKVHNLLHKIIN